MTGRYGYKTFAVLTGLLLILAIPAPRSAESTTQSDVASARSLSPSERHEMAMQALAQASSAAQGIREFYASRDEAFAHIAEVQVKMGNSQDALATVQRIEGFHTRANVLARIAETQARMGNIQGALETSRMITNNPARIDVLAHIATAQAGNAQDVLAIVQEIQTDITRAKAFTAVAVALAEVGDTSGAAQSFSQALLAAAMIEGDIDRIETFGHIVVALAKAGYVQTALNNVPRIDYGVARIYATVALAKAFIAIAEARVNAGDTQDANRFLSNALLVARNIEGDIARTEIFVRIAETQTNAGYFGDTMTTVERIEDARDRDPVVRYIAKTLATAGRIQDAQAAANMARSSWGRAYVFCDIAKAQVRSQDVQGAEQSLSEIFSDMGGYDPVELPICAAEVQMEMGNVEDAIETLNVILDDQIYIETLLRIAKAQAIAGNAQNARRLFSQALLARRGYRKQEDASSPLFDKNLFPIHTIGVAQAEVGYVQDALNTLQEIRSNPHRFYLLIPIAEAQVKAGAAQDAEQSLSQAFLAAQTPFDDQQYVLARIAQVRAEAGYFENALETAQTIRLAHFRAKAFTAIAKALAGTGDATQ